MAERTGVDICKRTVGEYSLSGYGAIGFVKRPVRSRMRGVGGRGREKLPFTRLGPLLLFQILLDGVPFVPIWAQRLLHNGRV